MAELHSVLRTALTLGVWERATLAATLLDSLDELSAEEAEGLWADEAQTRLEEHRAGSAETVDAQEVHRRAERLFQ